MKIFYDGQYGERCETLENASGDWTRIATYGDVPNVTPSGERVIQRFEKSDAEKIVQTFSNNWARLKKFLGIGSGNIPVVRGHTDTGNVDDQTLVDTTQYAQISALDARDDGLYAQINKGAEFGQLLANGGHLEYSPTWRVQEDAKGSGVFRPFRLISLGMVPKGNLRNATLVNSFGGNDAAEQNKDKNDMEWTDEQKARLAEVLGVEAEALGDAEAVIAAVSGMKPPKAKDDEKKTEPTPEEEDAMKKKKDAAKVLVNAAFADSLILANEVAAMRDIAELDIDGAKAMIEARRAKNAENGRSTTLQNAEAAAKAREKEAANRDAKITTMVNAKIADFKRKGITPPRASVLWAQCEQELSTKD